MEYAYKALRETTAHAGISLLLYLKYLQKNVF